MTGRDWVTPRETIQRGLKIQDVISYALAQGWQPVADPQDVFLLFEGPLDVEQKPLILALTKKDEFQSTPMRIAEAINQLAAVEQRSPSELLDELVFKHTNSKEIRDRKSTVV